MRVLCAIFMLPTLVTVSANDIPAPFFFFFNSTIRLFLQMSFDNMVFLHQKKKNYRKLFPSYIPLFFARNIWSKLLLCGFYVCKNKHKKRKTKSRKKIIIKNKRFLIKCNKIVLF